MIAIVCFIVAVIFFGMGALIFAYAHKPVPFPTEEEISKHDLLQISRSLMIISVVLMIISLFINAA